MRAKNTRLGFRSSGPRTVEELQVDINTALDLIGNLLDQDASVRGTAKFHGAVDFGGNQGLRLAKAEKGDDVVRFDQLTEEIRRLEQQIEELKKLVPGGVGLTRPTTAPPEVEDLSAIGTYNGRGANEGHTHSGVNLGDIQTLTGLKTLALPILVRTRLTVLGFTAANGANNNIAVGEATIIRITGPSAGYSITGIAGGVDGRFLILWNDVAQVLTLANLNGGSVAASQIETHTGADVLTVAEGVFILFYSSADSLWHLAGSQL